MNPTTFFEANCKFKAPVDLDESQVSTIDAYRETKSGGNLDGSQFVIVAWQPTEKEIEQMKLGAPVFLTMLGGLAPHFLTTDFDQAKNF